VERGSSDEIWRAENRATMDAWNDYMATHGIPYAEYRRG
jgi:antitoxin CcdA